MEQKEINSNSYQNSFYTKAIEIIVITLVILTPLVFCPYLIRNFNPAKELVFEILTIIGLTFWAFRALDKERIKFSSSPLNLPILSFMVICVFSLFWSDSPFISLIELPLFLTGPILYFVVINNIYHKKQIDNILNAILIIGALLGIYGILQYQGIDFSFWGRNVGRLQIFGLFGNVNYFAEYLIVPLSIAVPLFFISNNRIKKVLLLIGILSMGITLIVTLTRGSYIAFAIALIFMVFLLLLSGGKGIIKRNKKIILLLLTAVIIATLLFIIPNPLNKPGTVFSTIKERISISQFTQGQSIIRRFAIWKFTIPMIKDHPLLGSGLGTYKYNSLRYQAVFFEQGQNRSLYPYGFATKAHNEYLQLWAEIGIIGLAIFIWLMITYFNYGIRYLKRENNKQKKGIVIGLMGAVVAVLMDGMFGFPLHLPATIALFWLALALTVVMIKREADVGEINIAEEDTNKKIKREKESKVSKYKPIFYLMIILLSLFLCVIMACPFVSQIYQFYGIQSLKKADYDGAIKYYHEALKWNPYFGLVYYDIGLILSEKSIYGLAIENFEKAGKYIDHPYLPQKLAYLYLRKGQGDKAISKLKQAISYEKNEKSMVPLYTDLGKLYLQARRYELAEVTFGDALKITPDFVNAHYGLAVAYLQQNRQAEALEELQKVIELAPDSQEAKNAQDIMQQIAQETLNAPPIETDNP
jgi:O-antigen ligase/Tfp pilus assembly protein PilF